MTLMNPVVPLTAPRHTLAAALGTADLGGLLGVTAGALALRLRPRGRVCGATAS